MHLALPPLILASGSPRRRELLAEAGYQFTVCPPSDLAEGGFDDGEPPPALVARLARQKAADVAARYGNALIIGCDTVVECQNQILGKPADVRDAERMLRLLSGSEHRVYSGVCLYRAPGGPDRVCVAVTTLVMNRLGTDQLQQYLESDDWIGKAGAFGYQDGHDWLRIVAGSPSNVVGLPLELLDEMLRDWNDPKLV